MKDYTSEIAEFWSTIMKAWQEHKDKHPLIEYNLLERKVFAYPAKDYINTLSERTRLKTLRQYKQVTSQGGMMVFIIDPKSLKFSSRTSLTRKISSCKKPNNETEMK